jgi:hypothetical protein
VSGKLDLADNSLLWDYTAGSPIGAWAGSAYTGLTGLIAAGRSGGTWGGNGLVTSRPNALGAVAPAALGVAEAANVLDYGTGATATYAGQSVDQSAVLVRYTWSGDADLSGSIEGDDFFLIDAGFAAGTRSYFGGDFDFSGSVDADDYFLIDSIFNKATGLLT